MAWRLAYSLETLRDEINTRWPNRNKASDGTIGDPAHAAQPSDHNPNPAGVVCAFDITNDNINGPGSEWLAQQFLANIHPDAKYFIWNQKIASRTHEWTIRPYTGDPHTSHIHVSVGVGPDGQSQQPYDDRTPLWLPPIVPPIPLEEEVTPAVTVDNGNVWYFITGTDRQVWAKRWDQDWFPIGGEAYSGPAATAAAGTVTVCVKGKDDALWAIQRDTQGVWHDWFSVGGLIHD
jgi:hypothetical protein